MTPKETPKINIAEFLDIVEKAKKAELMREIDSLWEILQPVIPLLESATDHHKIEPAIMAELLRLYGFYLTFHGRAKNLKNYQDYAKNVITRSIELFDSQKLGHKVAESYITLGFCYWNRGEVKEAEAYYELVENDFAENKISPVYLQLQINRMMLLCWDTRFDDSFSIFRAIEPLMPFCKDMRLRIMFHFESGILMHRLEKYNEAIVHFTETIVLCKKEDHQFLLALNYNNFSLLYLDIFDYKKAHFYSDEAFEILNKINHTGWMAHVLDSKAQIYLAEGDNVNALRLVENSLKYFIQGEDYKGLTCSMWTKIQCLLKLEKLNEALTVFAELYSIARENISEELTKKYTSKLSQEIYILRKIPLLDEVAQFKKSQIKNALIKANFKISNAAKILGLKNHQTLSDILDKQFPELYVELNFSRRTRKKSGKSDGEIKTVLLNRSQIRNENPIQRVVLNNKNYAFDFDFEYDGEKFKTFYFDKFQMSVNFGIDEGCVVATSSIEALTKKMIGKYVMIVEGEKITPGRLEFDETFYVYYLSTADGEPYPIEENFVLREIVGFCPLDETKETYIRFSKI